MELTEVMKQRRSVHKFQDRPVPVELVAELLETSVWAPNHKLTQPWRFVIVQGEGRKKLAEVSRTVHERREKDPVKSKTLGEFGYNKLMAVPLFLAVVMREDTQLAVREEDYAATCCVIHNFGLLAWEQGIGVVWETYGLIHQPDFRAALGVQPGEKIVGSLHVGYPAAIPPAQARIPAAQLLTVIES
ncbi:nitroreductase [Paenibacillus sp. PAMC21692]|uniref:nitroreductase family protein n=1 Tax=Paenibacillus sp. PAMC21692 TaxID=2762320 RepID=UPI00164E35F0|nr:nitroreductase [Paenibacillus sp. PAMC21692]QNK57772.1 nitroreductase [Paenibacillus sp. PAMC21692]